MKFSRDHFLSPFIGAAVGVGLAVGLAVAADQTILGKSLSVKNPNNTLAKRSVKAKGKEKNSPNLIVGNPTLAGSAGGAILEIFLSGASSSNQVFILPQGTSISGKPFWAAKGTAYKYKDAKGQQGPVKAAAIKRSPNGTFSISVGLKGANGPISLVPPNPGTSACVALKLGISAGTGDRYSVAFGADGQITNIGSTLFKVKNPTLQSVCSGATTSTTTTTSTSTTTTTTLYGSPSRAFLSSVNGLLD